MKKSLLIFLLLIGLLSALSAVPRELVVVEIGTGTWCGYCPGAAMGAHDLLSNGHPVAIVKNHNGDTYANTYSNARNSYYAITGYPTARFDGLNPSVGGSATQSMYGTYLPRVNARLAVPSHYTLTAAGSISGNDYMVIVNIAKPEEDSNPNVVLHACLTQSNIPVVWGNQTDVDNVNRLMMPDQNGTPVNINTGEETSVSINFTTLAAWPLENLELVIWLQNTVTKEILQGKKYALNALPTGGAVSTDMLIFPDTSINSTNTMPLTLANFGSTPVTGSISIDNPAFSSSASTFTLPAASATTVNVSFNPSIAQVYDGTLTITSNFPDNPVIQVMLSGLAFSNTPPVVTNVNVVGPPVLHQILQGSYTFSDPEGHIEGATQIKWYRIVDSIPVLITGATSPAYQITTADVGYALAFEVTPIDFYNLAGTSIMSSPTPVIIPLPYPQNFTAQLTPPNTVICNWEKPQYFDGRGFIGYRLYRDGLNIQTIPNPNTLTFTDTNVNDGTHEYWICSLFSDPSYMSDPSPVVVVYIGVANDDLVNNPISSINVHPNPFNAIASIAITGKANTKSVLEIYNLKGQIINTLDVVTDNTGKAAVQWDGKTKAGKQAINGVYLYRLDNGNNVLSGKMMLAK
ncbi:MAG: FlgD immunoglobulin-like domain containing protein [Candidatus Cloacimonetes bacterium]|nr:FlgD immunoglobulin-like domain containing protein [Candidatus Cloacimonadota bacterium]